MTRTSQKNDRFAQLACALLLAAIAAAGLLVDARPAAADAACVVDTGAADDSNATQKDLNEFCLSVGNDGGLSGCSSADANLTWTWDDTGLTGSNTGDACALYDTDADGNANYALCASVENNPTVQSAGSPRFYLCDDSKTLNCGGASTVATSASACAVSNVADVFTGAHQAGNPCTGGNCSTRDTQAQCCVKNGDFPSGSAPELIDVCSYPSSSPSSSPSECVKTVLCTTDADCGELTDGCNVGSCASDGLTKRCVATSKTNGTACDDSDACTETDTCQAGVCTGDVAVVCEASDQCHAVGTCDPATGVCSDPAKEDGATCNDGDACTQTDTCQSGTCGGSDPVECTASDQCHDAGICDPSTGVCSDPAKEDGATCNDADACTQTDTCQSGTCGGANPVTCSAPDQCHDAGTCDPSTGVCSNPSRADGSACSDGNACTQTDTCQSGTCSGANSVTCSPLDQCHDAGTCNTTTGLCSNPAKADGATCSDGNACTQTDTCQSGTCGGANPVTCSPLDQCHDAGTCNTTTGLCSNPAKADGATCSDGNACTQTDTCQSGTCGGANPVTCSPLDQCHDAGTCNTTTGLCSNPAKADGATCSDGNACTGTDSGDHCDGSGQCVPGTAVVCAAGDACHEAGTCDPATGQCSAAAKPSGTACSDGNACTGNTGGDDGDRCDDNGQCVPGAAVECAAADACHEAGTCDPATGQCSAAAKPNGTPCSDSNACTGVDDGDRCNDNGQCVPGTAVECAAADACHEAGTCDPATGQCSAATKPSGTPCSDGNACTGNAGGDDGDRCNDSGQCVPGTAVECAASDDCHEAGTCNPATGQCSAATKPSGTPCSDGSACTGNAGGADGDRCDDSGQCVPGAAVECAASDDCHEASACDPATGQCSAAAKPSGTPCSDGNACTGVDDGDRCDSDGQCVPGAAVVCAAADDCHEAGTCDPTTGKCSENVKAAGSECTDGNPCTLGDACDGDGVCTAGPPRDCSSDDPCHESSTCDVSTGTCVVTPKAVDCGDAVCSTDPACVEICDNCIDDNGDGSIDRDDPTCMPFADGLGTGTGDPKKRGAGVAKCQSAIQAAGVRLATKTRVSLQQCGDAVFRCIQQKADDPTCLTKARARCVKQAEALADGPRSLAAKLRIKIAKSCGQRKAGLPPRVSREDLCNATGLGFLGEIGACDDPNTSAAAVLDELADHLVHEERCRIAQLFTASTPRGAELLTLGDLHMSEDECLDGERDRGALGLASPVGKAAVKCEKTIGSSSTRFFNRVTSSYRRCAAAVFRCVQQKSNDPRCQAKAERRCLKLTATLFEGPRSVEARMRTTIARACGPRKGKPVLLGPVQLSELAGLGYNALESRCNALGVAALQSLDDIDECMVRQYVCRAEQVLTSQMPRTHELLDLGKARRR